jgi:hypothetical protein
MILAGLFGGALFVALVVGDWFHFTSLTAPATRYGLTVSRAQSRLQFLSFDDLRLRFGENGVLRLPHGIARLFPEQRRILLRPQYQFFSLQFRTAWPLKGSIEVADEQGSTRLLCLKRVPWSSALLTFAWFVLVALGTVTFIASFLANGGFSSLSGVVMGVGIVGLGLLVIGFGLVVVTLAYRLEDRRLTAVYEELLRALNRDARAEAT